MKFNSLDQKQGKRLNNNGFNNKKHNANQQGFKKTEAQKRSEFFLNKPHFHRLLGKLISAFTSRKDSDPYSLELVHLNILEN